MAELPWSTIRYVLRVIEAVLMFIILNAQLEKMDSEKNSWCACGHTKDNTLSVPCVPGLQYKFRVTAVNRIGDSEALTSDTIQVSEGVDNLVR